LQEYLQYITLRDRVKRNGSFTFFLAFLGKKVFFYLTFFFNLPGKDTPKALTPRKTDIYESTATKF